MSKPKNLEDVPLPYLGEGYDQIEKGIANLVRALIGLGITTTASCEGHENNNKNPYVLFNADETERKKLNSILEHYNGEKKVKWKICDRNVYPHMWKPYHSTLQPNKNASNKKELKILQYSSENLAQFILDNYIR